jgi:hypothetical protein
VFSDLPYPLGVNAKAWTPLILVAAPLAIVAALVATLDDTLTLVLLASPILLLLLARRRLLPVYLSPVWITPLVLLGVGVVGAWFGTSLNGLRGGGARVSLPAGEVRPTLQLFATSALFVAVGGTTLLSCVKRPTPLSRTFAPVGVVVSDGFRALLLAAATAPAVMLIFTINHHLLHRASYLAVPPGSSVGILGLAAALAAVGAAGYIVAADDRHLRKVFAAALVVVYVLIFFSMGSRRLALVPIIFTLGVLLASRGRRAVPLLIVSAVLALLLVPVPLFLRGQMLHGLYPYVASLSAFSYTDVDWLATANNTLIAFPLSGITAFHTAPLPLSTLFIELNPLPGGLAGWYDVKQTLRFNAWTPYPAVGELGNYGGLVMALVWLGVGFVLGYLEMRVRVYRNSTMPVFAVALIGLTALFAIQALQYSVRSSFRMLVYAVALDLFMRAFLTKRDRVTSRSVAPSPGIASVVRR